MAELGPGLKTSPFSQGEPINHTASPQVRGGDSKARGEVQIKGSGTLRVSKDINILTEALVGIFKVIWRTESINKRIQDR